MIEGLCTTLAKNGQLEFVNTATHFFLLSSVLFLTYPSHLKVLIHLKRPCLVCRSSSLLRTLGLGSKARLY